MHALLEGQVMLSRVQNVTDANSPEQSRTPVRLEPDALKVFDKADSGF